MVYLLGGLSLLLAATLLVLLWRKRPHAAGAVEPVVTRLIDMLETTVHRQDQQLRAFGDRMLSVSDHASDMIRQEWDAKMEPKPPKPPTVYLEAREPEIGNPAVPLDTIGDGDHRLPHPLTGD